MAKDLPYFKFKVASWLTGDIVFESLSVQGLFANICALYWQRNRKLSINDINKRYKNPSELAELTDRFISVKDGFISISFLDEQFEEMKKLSGTNSQNGKKGGRPKGSKIKVEKPTANRPLTEHKPNESNIDKKRKDIYNEYLGYLNLKVGKAYRGAARIESAFYARLSENYTLDDFKKAIDAAVSDKYHQETKFGYLTAEFFTRPDKLDKFVNASGGGSSIEKHPAFDKNIERDCRIKLESGFQFEQKHKDYFIATGREVLIP